MAYLEQQPWKGVAAGPGICIFLGTDVVRHLSGFGSIKKTPWGPGVLGQDLSLVDIEAAESDWQIL